MSLYAAKGKGCKSITIPAISSGIFGFPRPLCARMLYFAALEFDYENREDPTNTLKVIRFTNIDEETCRVLREEFAYIFLKVPKNLHHSYGGAYNNQGHGGQ